MRRNPLLRTLAPIALRGDRRARFDALPTNIMVHDLSKGIPYPDGSADAVYHSHVLEHLDRDVGRGFLRECARVLKPGGVLRVVVPDMEGACRAYLEDIARCETDRSAWERHETHIATIIEQMVRREPFGTSRQAPLRRTIENMVLGDARDRGETHQWMYDRFSLMRALQESGFDDVAVMPFDQSRIEGWSGFRLDVDEKGGEYKHESIYVEGVKGKAVDAAVTVTRQAQSSTEPVHQD